MPDTIPRPQSLDGSTIKFLTGCGPLYITVNRGCAQPAEVFAYFGHAGSCLDVCLSSLCKLASVALQAGIDPDLVVHCLKGFQCQGAAWDNGRELKSCPDAIGQYLECVFDQCKEGIYESQSSLPLQVLPNK